MKILSKPASKQRHWLLGGASVIALAGAMLLAPITPATATSWVIYSDPLNGSSVADLNGTTPSVSSGLYGGTAGATWSATIFKADGSVSINGSPGYANAFLPFTPQTGQIYRLSADVDTTAGGPAWIGLGFTSTANLGAFIFGNTAGPWMLLRNDRELGQGQTFLGPNLNGDNTYDAPTGVVHLTVELDTMVANNWTGSFFANGVLVGSGSLGTPSIGYVDLSAQDSVSGVVQNVSLETEVPEPSSALLLIPAAMALGSVRRQRG